MVRKIIHVDMDAFYASVEQRDDPQLRGKPVVVAWRGKRSVVCAASYEARRFGVHSAMPAVRAERLCPEAVFVPPDFVRYRAVSRAVRAIFLRYTDLIEPLSLDEAYLDVTENKAGLATATRVAKAIRQEIREELHLTASAGVAPNKFLAKIASDWRKPDGLFVIQPEEVEAFLPPLPVGRIPGVGKVTEERLKQIGVQTVGDLHALETAILEAQFGKYGHRLYLLARGIDHSEVVPDRPTKSISAEDTFEHDIPLAETGELIERLAAKVWTASRQESRLAHTVVLKLKTSEFNIITRSYTPNVPPASCAELTAIALALRERIALEPGRRFRLVGVGLSNFREQTMFQSGLFAEPADAPEP
jgi:DNA polymerase-4